MKDILGTHARWMPKEEFDAIYSKVPRLTVELLVRTPKGMVLSKRSIEPCIGQWHIPGGTVFYGEKLVEAVRRVALAELGIDVKIVRQVGYIEYPLLEQAGYKGWPIGVAFEVTVSKGEPSGSAQGEEIGFFKQVPDNTVADQVEFLRQVL